MNNPNCECPYSLRNSSCCCTNMNGIIWRSFWEAKSSVSHCGHMHFFLVFCSCAVSTSKSERGSWLTDKFDASRCEQLWVVSLHVLYWPLNQFVDVFDANHSTTGSCLWKTNSAIVYSSSCKRKWVNVFLEHPGAAGFWHFLLKINKCFIFHQIVFNNFPVIVAAIILCQLQCKISRQ